MSVVETVSPSVLSPGEPSCGTEDATNDEDQDTPEQYADFVVLTPDEATQRLKELARPETAEFAEIHSVTLQPCRSYSSQDRHVVQQLRVHNQLWTFTGVFDGHLGDATVQHTAYHLPIIVKQFLEQALSRSSANTLSPQTVSDILSHSITSFDEAIAGDVLELFPGGIDSLPKRTNEEIRSVVNDYYDGGENYQKARLAMHGTTALVALVDPEHSNLWIANLGDCEAVLVAHSDDGLCKAEALTSVHNGGNESEVQRVQREHPGESEAVVNERVLGAIAPFRSIGDAPFKQPALFTRRVLYNLYPGIPDSSPWDTFLDRNKSPPYISSQPDILHKQLRPPGSSTASSTKHHLILATDGLTELYDEFDRETMINDWASGISSVLHPSASPTSSILALPSSLPALICSLPALAGVFTSSSSAKSVQKKSAGDNGHDSAERADSDRNLALVLLRRALGGEPMDVTKVSQMLTLDMERPWMDDTTIIVQAL